MFEQEPQVPVFRKTLNKLIQEIEKIKNLHIHDFEKTILECFEGYDYEDSEDLKGLETWDNIKNDGEHEIEVGINHEHAYLLTLHLTTSNSKITVTNVL